MADKKKIVASSFFKFFGIIFLGGFCLVGCSEKEEIDGYVEGRLAYISSTYTGILKKLYVARGDHVKIGQPLFLLTHEPESFITEQAQSNLEALIAEKEQNDANLKNLKTILQRRQTLLAKKLIDQESVDIAETNYKTTLENADIIAAKIKTAKSNLDLNAWSQAQKSINAEIVGTIFDTYYLPSELVPANQPIVSILAPDQIYMVFFVPENKLSQIHLKQKVFIGCDGTTNRYPATISYIASRAEYTPPFLYMSNARSNLVFRIEAKTDSLTTSCSNSGQPITVFLH